MAYAPSPAPRRAPARRTPNREPAPAPSGRFSRAETAQVTAANRLTVLAAGFALGLAIGAAIGLLYAPQSGARTRGALRRRGKKVRNRAADAWEDLRLELDSARRGLARRRRDRQVDAED